MAKAAPKAKIETVEIDPDMAGIARSNIVKAGLGDRIRVILGDASDVFPALSGNFDMIFLDSAKGQYVRLLDDVVRLLSPGGLLVADNCIFYGKVYDDPASAPHKHRTIVANMRSFLERVLDGSEFQGTLLETGDGMLAAVRI
jgi:predicted O-methyltransferase YrrM